MLSLRICAAVLCAGSLFIGADPVDILPDESLKGWTRVPWTATLGLQPAMQWRVDPAQRALICSGTGGHEWLRYDKLLGDFVFEVDWRFTPRSPDEQKYNSGVGVRLSPQAEFWVQAQTGLAGGYLFGNNLIEGTLQRVTTRDKMKENRVKPAGEWNHYELRVEGDKVTLAVNGAPVSELAGLALRKGHLALEAEGFEIAFRHLKLTELQ
jgi:hypothetical protein